MQEIWKDIKGYEGLYQVSNLGRVKSLPKLIKNSLRCYTSNEKILKGRNQRGWLKVRLYKNKKGTNFLIHRLVMINFVGNSYLEVNHKNGIKYDNNLNNLEYVTSKENTHHAIKMGMVDLNHIKNLGKKNSIPVRCINNGVVYKSRTDAAKKLNLFHSNICKVLSGEYKHSGGYRFENYLIESGYNIDELINTMEN